MTTENAKGPYLNQRINIVDVLWIDQEKTRTWKDESIRDRKKQKDALKLMKQGRNNCQRNSSTAYRSQWKYFSVHSLRLAMRSIPEKLRGNAFFFLWKIFPTTFWWVLVWTDSESHIWTFCHQNLNWINLNFKHMRVHSFY